MEVENSKINKLWARRAILFERLAYWNDRQYGFLTDKSYTKQINYQIKQIHIVNDKLYKLTGINKNLTAL